MRDSSRSLLQAEDLALPEQTNRFLQPPELRRFELGRVDPGEVAPALLDGKRHVIASSLRIVVESGRDVRRELYGQDTLGWLRSRPAIRWSALDPGRRQSSRRLERCIALTVH